MVDTNCKFSFNECFSKKCNSFNLCALTSTEKTISKIEFEVGEIFQSLNLLSEVTSSNSERIIQIKGQLDSVLEHASEFKNELSKITNELKDNNEKIESLTKEIAELKSVFLSEKGKN
jgi:chromosome segregation ATPase